MASLVPYLPVPLGFTFLRRRSGVNPLIVNYHMVSDEELPFIRNLYNYRDVGTFRKDLEFYKKHFTPIPMDHLLASLKGETDIPDNSLLITFDDGFREVHDIVAPILKNSGIPATFFLNRDFIDNRNLNHDNKQALLVHRIDGAKHSLKLEVLAILKEIEIPEGNLRRMVLSIPYQKRDAIEQVSAMLGLNFQEFLEERKPYMDGEQISKLVDQGFYIGGHSIDHARFNELSSEEQLMQATESVDYLVKKFRLRYKLFAFPYSDRGSTSSFFEKFSGKVDASFGTHGLLEDPVSNHFQRISVEKYNQSAYRTLKYHLARRNIYNQLGRHKITRSQE